MCCWFVIPKTDIFISKTSFFPFFFFKLFTDFSNFVLCTVCSIGDTDINTTSRHDAEIVAVNGDTNSNTSLRQKSNSDSDVFAEIAALNVKIAGIQVSQNQILDVMTKLLEKFNLQGNQNSADETIFGNSSLQSVLRF
ncbi:uncharacterized protein LOC113471016 [Diaphorina citri]|uniref:Uncharacterized protein LOC113471016 n=1 Tax=Diaphorina citri TaxID=121845 RepID=A0A3Q0JG30_DIACI|nr:uncharacterized protein LOC113471016 [Diaphorina citri]